MDRITRLRIRNVRNIESLDLEISPVTVLIGENGSGKSTIIECLELLHKAADQSFFNHFYHIHRGMPGLLRKGETTLSLGVTVEDSDGKDPPIEYDFSLTRQNAGAVISKEQMTVGPAPGKTKPLFAIDRTAAGSGYFNQEAGKFIPLGVAPDQLVINLFGIEPPPQEAIVRLRSVLSAIETHLMFDTLALWAAQSYRRETPLRGPSLLWPAERLTLLGTNLTSAWSALKNDSAERWNETMELVRLGLGDAVDSINTIPDAGGGNVSLALKRKDLAEPIPSANLSDGQLAWLGFVAMAQLNRNRSLLAVDEPELHLHPALLGRVIDLLTHLDNGAPAVLSTHSDRVLELLDDPADAVRVCGFDEQGRAVVSRIDPEELEKWLKEFGDVGQLRASGYLDRVLVPTAGAAPGDAE